MSITLLTVEIRNERRVRLVFTNTLSGGAFGAPAPGFYTLTCVDGRAVDPSVDAALIVGGNPSVVELVLGDSIIKGVQYNLSAIGVPATDASVTDSGAVTSLIWGLYQAPANVEPALRNKRRLIYGVDILWNGADFQETATADLESVEGPPNVTKALNKRVMTNPGDVSWAPDYGAGARNFVDSPSSAAGTLSGSVSSQLLQDPRVKSLKVSHEISDEKTFLYADPVLVSGEPVERVSIAVPTE